MEASQAGLAGQNGQGEGGEGQAQPGFDAAALAEQLGSEFTTRNAEQLREMLPQMLQEYQQAQQEPEAEPDGDLNFDFMTDPEAQYEDPRQVAERLQQQFDQRLQQALDAKIGPLEQQQTEMRHRQEAQNLVDEFPQLADPDTARQVVETSRALAEQLGQPQLAAEPAFWRLAFMSLSASEAAQNEGSEDPAAAHLEGAGGAGPAAPQMDPMAIFGGADEEGPGGSVLPFG
jgi:hypothetical protein